jgi:hypothetical protein
MGSSTEILNKVFDSNTNSIKTELGSSPTAISDGLKLVTTAATRETLVASTTACKAVAIQAKYSNTGQVAVGGSTVVAASGATRRGVILYPGDTVTLPIDDLVKVYLDVTVSGEGVNYTAVA